MPSNIHPHRPLVRTFIACQQVSRTGSLITLVGLIEKITARAESGHFEAVLYVSLTSGQGRHRIQLQIAHFDTTGDEISHEIARKSIIDLGSDPLQLHGLAIPVRVHWQYPGAIVFRLLVDGVVCGTLDLPVR